MSILNRLAQEHKENHSVLASVYSMLNTLHPRIVVDLLSKLYAYILTRIPERYHDEFTDALSTSITKHYYEFKNRHSELIDVQCTLCNKPMTVPEECIEEIHLCTDCLGKHAEN